MPKVDVVLQVVQFQFLSPPAHLRAMPHTGLGHRESAEAFLTPTMFKGFPLSMQNLEGLQKPHGPRHTFSGSLHPKDIRGLTDTQNHAKTSVLDSAALVP